MPRSSGMAPNFGEKRDMLNCIAFARHTSSLAERLSRHTLSTIPLTYGEGAMGYKKHKKKTSRNEILYKGKYYRVQWDYFYPFETSISPFQ